jgi:hypothetical protein
MRFQRTERQQDPPAFPHRGSELILGQLGETEPVLLGHTPSNCVRQFDGSAVLERPNCRTAGTHGTAVRSQADRHGVGAPNAFTQK